VLYIFNGGSTCNRTGEHSGYFGSVCATEMYVGQRDVWQRHVGENRSERSVGDPTRGRAATNVTGFTRLALQLVIYSVSIRQQSIAMSVSVCLSASISPELHINVQASPEFCACYPRPRLGPPLRAAVRYSIHNGFMDNVIFVRNGPSEAYWLTALQRVTSLCRRAQAIAPLLCRIGCVMCYWGLQVVPTPARPRMRCYRVFTWRDHRSNRSARPVAPTGRADDRSDDRPV